MKFVSECNYYTVKPKYTAVVLNRTPQRFSTCTAAVLNLHRPNLMKVPDCPYPLKQLPLSIRPPPLNDTTHFRIDLKGL